MQLRRTFSDMWASHRCAVRTGPRRHHRLSGPAAPRPQGAGAARRTAPWPATSSCARHSASGPSRSMVVITPSQAARPTSRPGQPRESRACRRCRRSSPQHPRHGRRHLALKVPRHRAMGRTGGRPTVMDGGKLAAARARREPGPDRESPRGQPRIGLPSPGGQDQRAWRREHGCSGRPERPAGRKTAILTAGCCICRGPGVLFISGARILRADGGDLAATSLRAAGDLASPPAGGPARPQAHPLTPGEETTIMASRATAATVTRYPRR